MQGGIMWHFRMDRQELEAFLREHRDEFLDILSTDYWDDFMDILLTAYGMTVDGILTCHMADEVKDWIGDTWEAC